MHFQELPSFVLDLQGFHADQARRYGSKCIFEPSGKCNPLAVFLSVSWLDLEVKNRLNSEKLVMLVLRGVIEPNSSIVLRHRGLKSIARQSTPYISCHSRE
jgi:hypothetical protein